MASKLLVVVLGLGEGRLTPVGYQPWKPPGDRSSSVGVVTPGTPAELAGSDDMGRRAQVVLAPAVYRLP